MKKGIIIAVVAVVAVAAIVCGVIFLGGAPKVEVADSADVLNKVFSTYAEEEKFFGVGGDAENAVDNAPGIYSLEDKEGMVANLHVSEDLIGQVDEAASYMHAMMPNNCTSAAFHLVDAKSAESFAASLKESVFATQWMCGQPDTFVMYSINGGEYVVYAVGVSDIIDNFAAKLVSVYGEAAVELANEAVIAA